jgi:hypothetical protein
MPTPPQQRPTELYELAFSGPFGGIQSQAGLSQIETDGFFDVQDILFLHGQLMPRQRLNTLPSPAAGPILGIFDFFNYQATRFSGVFTNSGLYRWVPSTQNWASVGGTVTGSGYESWTVVGGKLCFSNGSDPIQSWDGVTAPVYVDVAVPRPAYHLGELNNHLIACPVVEGGAFAPQRVAWSGNGNPSDWTSFNSGETDLFNDLGPINNWRKVYQVGYVFQQWGIVSQYITGDATVPFEFYPLSSKSKGLYYPYTLSGFGEFAIYAGKDNIYLFDGSSSQPIGDMPLEGRAWIGARRRIIADLLVNGNPNTPYGYYTTSTNGKEFETYILIIPNTSCWIFNMRESNWTRVSLTEVTNKATVAGSFFTAAPTRIIDLVGPVSSQNVTFAQLAIEPSALDNIAIGGDSGYVGLFDFTGAPTPCRILTGTLSFSDPRHSKNVRRIRFKCEALQSFDVTVTARNEEGQTEQETYTIAANSDNTDYQVVPFHIPGFFITFTFAFNNAVVGQFNISEIAIGFETGAEARTK